MSDKKVNKAEENLAAVEQVLGKTEQFVEKNKKLLSYVVIGIISLILLIVLYFRYVENPKKIEAYDKIAMAQKYYELDSLDKALNGDGVNLGFLQIIDQFGGTPSGNLANFYVGSIYLQKGGKDTTSQAKGFFEKAIEYFGDYSGDDMNIAPTAKGRIGDAYMELGQTDKALELYLEAARLNENKFTTPQFLFRAGQTYSLLKQHEKALELYKEIESKYFASAEAREIKKYIGYEEQLLGK